MKFTACGCDSYGGTCPACLAKQNTLLSPVKVTTATGAQIMAQADSALAMQIGGEHYKSCKIQPIQFIEANALGFLEGCVVKRVTRHNKSTGKGRQDIEKAIHELQLLLELRYPMASC